MGRVTSSGWLQTCVVNAEQSPPDLYADDTIMAYEYRYGLATRPAELGSVPHNKPYRLEPPLCGEEGCLASRHGVIVFERPLSVEELYAFDLALLADEDLKSALATEIALELAAWSAERFAGRASKSQQMPSEYSADFRRMVADTLSQIRVYRVYVGDISSFSRLVLARLEAIGDDNATQDAEVLSILHARQYSSQHAVL
jgi:hypothetical protein